MNLITIRKATKYSYTNGYQMEDRERGGGVIGAWGGQAGTALQYTLIGVIILAMVFALMKLFFDTAEIPLTLVDRDVSVLSTKWPIADQNDVSNFNNLRCPLKGTLAARTAVREVS